MTAHLTTAPAEQTLAQKAVNGMFGLFLRMLAIVFFGFAIHSWLTAVGYWEGANFRFDTMPTTLKVYTATLLILHPVASVGLWTTLPWGRVVWFFAVGFQTFAIMRYDNTVEAAPWIISFHLACLAIYVVFQLSLSFINKEQ